MNSLSWTLYLADIAGSISTVATVTVLGSTVSAGVGAVCYAFAIADNSDDNKRASKRLLKWSLSTLAAACIIGIPIPSKNTIYAIAASQMGEQALQSQTGGKAMQALNAWLDRQIKGDGK